MDQLTNGADAMNAKGQSRRIWIDGLRIGGGAFLLFLAMGWLALATRGLLLLVQLELQRERIEKAGLGEAANGFRELFGHDLFVGGAGFVVAGAIGIWLMARFRKTTYITLTIFVIIGLAGGIEHGVKDFPLNLAAQ